MKVRRLILVCLLAAILIGAGCAPAKAPKARVPAGYESIRMIGSSLGGFANTAVMAIAAILNRHYPEIEWSSSSGSPGPSAIYLDKGTIKIGMTNPASYVDAFGFDKIAASRLRSMNLPQPLTKHMFFIPEDKPWKDITQVPKGLTLSPGTPGAAMVIACEAWLKLAGLSKADFRWVPMGKAELLDAWRAGRLDFYFSGVTSLDAFLVEIQMTPRKIKPMGLSPEQLAKAEAEQTFQRLGWAGVAMTDIAETIPEVFKYNVVAPQSPLLLVSREDFPEEIAYKMAKIIDEHNAELVAIFRGMKYATPEQHIKWARPPYDIHAGVAKYYKEKGYLK